MQDYVDILGVKIDKLDKTSLHQKTVELLSHRNSAVIFTPNPEMALEVSKDSKIAGILDKADLRIADGTGILLASHILRDPLPERLAGIEIGEFLIDYAAKNSLSIFLLGGKEGIAMLAKKRIEAKYEGINICGAHHGFFDVNGEKNDEIIKQINDASPDIIFVCMGFPRQEKWICENKDKIPSLRLALGLGGSLDVWSGKVRRAPRILRTLSLEWLYRIMREPKRMSFMTKIPVFILKVMAQKRSKTREINKKNSKNAHKF